MISEKIEANKLNACLTKLAVNKKDDLSYLYENLAKPIYLLAFSILKDKSLAEDVIQDTFLRIYEKVETYRFGNNPKAWILTIARNIALDKLRKRKHEITATDATENAVNKKTDNRSVDTPLMIEEAFAALTTEEAQIVTLYIYIGMKHKEIADMLLLDYSNVRKKYWTSIAKLNKYFREV